MPIVGQKVKHITFGEGVVKEISGERGIISVEFPIGEKRFHYPDAFAEYLSIDDPEKQQKITEKYDRQLQAEEEKRKKAYERHERRRRLRNMKIHPSSQAAFNIDPSDFKAIMKAGEVSTGHYLSGYSKGKPRAAQRVKPNSCCLITGIPDGGKEEDRLIYGAFMAAEDFFGENCEDGLVKGHKRYKIALPAAKTLRYWDMFESEDPLPRWGNVPFKFFSNSLMKRILISMKNQVAGTEKENALAKFYEYFCKINRLSMD